uniref:Histone deacetylase interacting domain-containing protein n=1 Tax=Odontella aurita TaxID=265563 RepID=A0A7S4MMK3_9STRA
MIKIEDERYEVDMAIERNSSAMKQVEPLAEEATALREQEERDGQPIGRLRYRLRPRSLSSNHICAVARLYGESGDEVVRHLARNPISVLPIVLRRLREKDAEWRRARADMCKVWRAGNIANFAGSFDVLCYFYRREAERAFATEALLEDVKGARRFVKHPDRRPSHPAARAVGPARFAPRHLTNPGALLFQSHLEARASNAMPHGDAYRLTTMLVMNGVAKTNADREKATRVWAEFVAPWFDLPAHWFLKELRERSRADKSSCVVKYAPGQKIRTAFGDGTILSLIEGGPSCAFRYKVHFPYGTSYVRPSAVVHVLPSSNKGTRYARRGGFMEFVELPERSSGKDAKLLDKSFQLVFGTEKVYIFMRLYCLLATLLSDARDLLGAREKKSRALAAAAARGKRGGVAKQRGAGANAGPDRMDVDEIASDNLGGEDKPKYVGYQGLVSALKDHLADRMDYKTYETTCRTLSGGEKVYLLAALPRLLDKTADAVVKVAREDGVLALFDLSQLRHRDPVLLRSQSLGVNADAVYRIQYGNRDGYVCMSYLPPEVDLLTSPRSGSSGAGAAAAAHGDEGGLTNAKDDVEMGQASGRFSHSSAKRMKLK